MKQQYRVTTRGRVHITGSPYTLRTLRTLRARFPYTLSTPAYLRWYAVGCCAVTGDAFLVSHNPLALFFGAMWILSTCTLLREIPLIARFLVPGILRRVQRYTNAVERSHNWIAAKLQEMKKW